MGERTGAVCNAVNKGGRELCRGGVSVEGAGLAGGVWGGVAVSPGLDRTLSLLGTTCMESALLLTMAHAHVSYHVLPLFPCTVAPMTERPYRCQAQWSRQHGVGGWAVQPPAPFFRPFRLGPIPTATPGSSVVPHVPSPAAPPLPRFYSFSSLSSPFPIPPHPLFGRGPSMRQQAEAGCGPPHHHRPHTPTCSTTAPPPGGMHGAA